MEIEEALENHKRIVHYMANRYRYLDERDDLISWAYIGFLKAYEEHKKTTDVELSSLIFRNIKMVYIKEYFEKTREMSKRDTSMEAKSIGKGGAEGDDLYNFLVDDSFHYSADDIESMLDEALFECDLTEKQLIMEHYLNDVDALELMKKYGLNSIQVKRLARRGYSLIIQYLENNLYITEWAMDPIKYKFTKREPIKALTPKQCRQLKYLRQEYPLLSRDDYANILECDIRSINYTLDYPTTTYIRYGLDDSIKDKAEAYVREHYPYMLPSEVEIYEIT